MRHICPVCGFDGLREEAYDQKGHASEEICVCCGFQFGFDDYPNKEKGIENWRNQWIKEGCKWFSMKSPPPTLWNAKSQLYNLGTGDS